MCSDLPAEAKNAQLQAELSQGSCSGHFYTTLKMTT